MNEWTWTRWWFVGWLLVAFGFGLQTITRLSGAQEFYDGRASEINVATWNLLMGGIKSGLFTVVLLYNRERDFKARLLDALAKVKLVHSTVKVTPTGDGLLLSPSPTPISRRGC